MQSKAASEIIRQHKAGKEMYNVKAPTIHIIKDSFLILIGIICAGFGLEGFLLPNSFIDGGVIGISLLIVFLTGYPLQLLILVINIPFIILGYTQIGKAFAIKSIAAIIGLALAITFIHYPVITSDKLLVSVFGGFFLGAGIGFAMRGGGVLDGTEVLAIFLSKHIDFSIGDIILVFNIIIFSFAAYVLSLETALYSILTFLAATKTVDFIIEGLKEYIGITIVSHESEKIRQMIMTKLGRGVTIYNGKKGFGSYGHDLNPIDIIFTVVTRIEISNLQNEVAEIDPTAYMVMNTIKYTKGDVMRKQVGH